MPRRLVRYSFAFALLWSSQAFALGLGEIRIDSALNEPLRAEIELLAASPDELTDLKITLASDATFERYGLDRPFFLSELQFQIFRTGRAEGNIIRVTSPSPITEPFVTFLIEANWPSGRLLREYTVLLDPPTFAPPAASQPAPAVAAPERTQPADSARIERQPAAPAAADPQPAPTPAPVRPAARPAPVEEPAAPADTAPTPIPADPAPAPVSEAPFPAPAGDELVVQRGDTLWGVASRMRPDSRLTMNQTMLAIFEANPDAFGGNINLLRAGATLRMPSADAIFAIDRGDALREAARQHAAWDSSYTPPPVSEPAPEPEPVATQPSLTLVPADEEPAALDTGTADSVVGAEPLTREQEVLDRIAEIEAEAVPTERSLIEIRDNELATLREELANIRGEVYEPPVDTAGEETAVDDVFVDDAVTDAELEPEGELFPDFSEATDDEAALEDTAAPAPRRAEPEPSLVEQAIGWATSVYAFVGYAVLLALLVLVWFVRRSRGDDDPEGWQPLDSDDLSATMAAEGGTETLRAPEREGAFVVEEQQQPQFSASEDTVESPALGVEDDADASGSFGSLEDTFSSETAVNLDQSDPIAEADFHMAYGLYDQAADLINGAIEVEPARQDLLSKLCEIYFVWGNRDAFVDAATRLKGVVGGGESAEWDKIVIMGQQIAGDHELFAGAGTAAATREMDLAFDTEDSGSTGSLDMEFGDDSAGDNVIDLGAETQSAPAAGDELDFSFAEDVGTGSDDSGALDLDLEATAESPTIDANFDSEITREMPSVDDTAESPTLEQPAAVPDLDTESTSQLPAFVDTDTMKSIDTTTAVDATAEIDLADLGLDVDGLAETELASLDDLDATGTNEALSEDALSDTGVNEALEEPAEITGKNPAVDPNATGVQIGLGDIDATGLGEALDIEDVMARTATGLHFAADETGVNPASEMVEEDAGLGIDTDLLAATGKTQVLPDDFAVQTGAGLGDEDATLLAPGLGEQSIRDEDATLLAGLDDEDEGDFDFAKTEALPPDAFLGSGDSQADNTGELPVASTDVDLDLDDLTSALKVSTGGDTVDMPRDDATVEQPRPDMSDASTMSLGPEDMDDDLEEARTMTEVGTKLDLARAYVDMGDPGGARSILEEVLDEGDEGQRQQAQSLLDSLPS